MSRLAAVALPAPARAVVLGLMAAMFAAGMQAQATNTPQNPARSLAQANAALEAGETDKALSLLHGLPQAGAQLAEAQNLACRVHLTLQQWDQAARECENAVRLDPQNSNDHLWLGRALGEKASRASFMSAYSLAKRVRMEFEAAVQLNPRNADALADLGEFYQQAPAIVGGGMEKAQGVAAQLDKVDSAGAHQLRARIAEAGKDNAAAEREFKLAIAAAAHPALQWATLAGFYRRRQRWQEMESALHNCLAAADKDRHAAVAYYDAAGLLIESNRDPALAARMLESYLAGPLKSEEAPAFEAHLRLARLKKQLGDTAGAQGELSAALALAHDYRPALEFKS